MKLYVLPEEGYENVKNNMYLGPIYIEFDKALNTYKNKEELFKAFDECCINIIGDIQHPIVDKAVYHIEESLLKYSYSENHFYDDTSPDCLSLIQEYEER